MGRWMDGWMDGYTDKERDRQTDRQNRQIGQFVRPVQISAAALTI